MEMISVCKIITLIDHKGRCLTVKRKLYLVGSSAVRLPKFCSRKWRRKCTVFSRKKFSDDRAEMVSKRIWAECS